MYKLQKYIWRKFEYSASQFIFLKYYKKSILSQKKCTDWLRKYPKEFVFFF